MMGFQLRFSFTFGLLVLLTSLQIFCSTSRAEGAGSTAVLCRRNLDLNTLPMGTNAPPFQLDPNVGADDLERLEAANARLERGDVSEVELETNFLIRSDEPVFKGRPPKQQRMPYRKVFLPFAKTGFYAPDSVILKEHQAIIVLMPGMGTNYSVAITTLDVAQSFRKGVVLHAGEPAFRAYPIALDLHVSGLGKDAPDGFASPEAYKAVLRHVHLILHRFYPHHLIFFAGRSQGGLAAFEYTLYYNDLNFGGAIGVNPTHPHPSIFRPSIEYHESVPRLTDIMKVDGLAFDNRAWSALKFFTPEFRYADPSSVSRSPCLAIIHELDTSYPQPHYSNAMKAFVAQQPDLRKIIAYVHNFGETHNLWDKSRTAISEPTFREMGLFMERQLQKRR